MANGLQRMRKCKNCGKEFDSFTMTGEIIGLGGMLFDKKYCSDKCKKEAQDKKSGKSGGDRSMHWKYFLYGGWILGIIVCCFIIPFFFPIGRRLITRAFGYW